MASLSLLNNQLMMSYFEDYNHEIQDQEISTKYLIHKRQVNNGLTPTSDE